MLTLTEKLKDSLYIAWAIATKDILDVLKNRYTLINLITVLGIVVFFYWASTVRPWDKRMEVTVFDQGNNNLSSHPAELSDGYSFLFSDASSLDELRNNVRFEALGVLVPPDFNQTLSSGEEATLTGYILWAFRGHSAELETLYSQKFSELLGQPVRVEINENFIKPDPNIQTNTVNFHILFATLFIAITLVPSLMLEEKRIKTMEALLVSPASEKQVVLGKALTGLFYMLLGGVVFFTLNGSYITNWGLALLAFLLCALFAIGLALALGSLVQIPQQLAIWMVPTIFLFIVPAFFANEPFLAPGVKAAFAWLPTTALVNIFNLSMSSYAPSGQLLFNIIVTVVGIILFFGIVVWKLNNADR
jgi:ABC-2 type transport system permease protein